MLATQKTLLSPEEYLVGEAQAEFRHEYVAGEVYAMAGASERHNRISGNLYFQLRAKARGSQRGVFMNDMKLRIQQGERFYYPDVMLGCNPDDSHEFYKDQPCLIAEVLSPSTETTDRREKWLAYAQIPSLRYYLLVETNRRHVEFYQRGYNGQHVGSGNIIMNKTGQYSLFGAVGKLLMLLLLLLILPSAQAATRILNSNGGQCAFDGANGGLTVHVGDNSQFQVERCSANGVTSKARQYYLTTQTPPSLNLFNSIFLRIGNTVFGANYSASPSWFGTNAAWTSVSSSGGSTLGDGTTTTVYKAVTGGLTYTVTQTVTYVFPNDFYSVKLDVNVPAGNTQNVRLYSWTDIMLDGDDNGSCSSSTTFPEYVIADNSAAGLPSTLGCQSLESLLLWFLYDPAWNLNYIGSGSGNLPNTIKTTNHDVGAAVQWDIGTVANTTFTAEYDFVFSLNKPTLTKRYGPNDGDTDHSMSAGDTTTPTFTNRPGNPAQGAMNFKETLPSNVTSSLHPPYSQRKLC